MMELSEYNDTRDFVIFVARPKYTKCYKMASSTKWCASRAAILAGHFAAFCIFWTRDENFEISSNINIRGYLSFHILLDGVNMIVQIGNLLRSLTMIAVHNGDADTACFSTCARQGV